MSTLATLSINVIANTGQALASLKGLSSGMVATGKSMTATGRTLTRNVTLPIVAAGAASLKMALDYEQAFTKISAISNSSAKEVAKWKEQVKSLAVATGRDPRELADALFFLASAGLKSDQVMAALEASAQASAVGLGEISDVAKLTANVLNAYAKSGITATQATDILVAAVKAGTAEPEEFAGAIGRILPIASKAKVGFDQVAASLAALSNIGLDVNEGVTAMRGALQAMVAPTPMAADALKKVGLAAQDLLDAFQQDGILGAFQLLDDRVSANTDTQAEWFGLMRQIIPNIRALTGEFALTGENASQVAKIFDQVTNSTGELGEALEKTQKDPAFQLQQQLAKLKVAAIDLGNTLIPIAKNVVEVIGDLAESFSKLSPETQENITKWLLLAAVVGPVLRLFGGIITTGGKVVGVLAAIGRAMTGLAAGSALGGAGAAAGGGAAGGGLLGSLGLGGAAAGAAASSAAAIASALALVGVAILEIATSSKASSEDVAAVGEELTRTGDSATYFRLKQEALRKEGEATASAWGGLKDLAAEFVFFWDSAQEAGEQAADAWARGNARAYDSIVQATSGARKMGAGISTVTSTMVLSLAAQGKYTEAWDILTRAMEGSRTVFAKQLGTIIENREALATWAPVLQRTTELTDRQRFRIGGLIQAVTSAGGQIKGLARNQLQAAIATGDLAGVTQVLHGILDQLPGNKKVKVEIPGLGSVIAQVGHLLDTINALPARKTIAINIAKEQGMGPPSAVPGGNAHSGRFIGGSGNVPIMAEGGEFVWAKSAVRNAGGPAALARVHNYFKRMHSGGPVGHHAGGGGGGLGSLVGGAEALAKQLKQLTEHLRRLGENAKAREETEKARDRVERELEKTLTQIGNRFEKLVGGFTKSFDDLQSQVEDLAGTIADFQESVKSGITSFASLTNLKGTPTGTNPGATLMAFLQGQLGQSQQFSSLIQELQAAGLSPDLVAQMAAAGPEMLTILQAIQQAGVGEVNAVWGQITSLAQTTAEALSGPLFGKQVDDLNKALAALERDFKALSKTFEDLPKKVKKDFLDEVSNLGKGLGDLARILKNIPGMQHGGTMAPSGGLAWVGEAGPELLQLPGGAQVIPAGGAGTVPLASLLGLGISGTLNLKTGQLDGRIVQVHEAHHRSSARRKSSL